MRGFVVVCHRRARCACGARAGAERPARALSMTSGRIPARNRPWMRWIGFRSPIGSVLGAILLRAAPGACLAHPVASRRHAVCNCSRGPVTPEDVASSSVVFVAVLSGRRGFERSTQRDPRAAGSVVVPVPTDGPFYYAPGSLGAVFDHVGIAVWELAASERSYRTGSRCWASSPAMPTPSSSSGRTGTLGPWIVSTR